MSSNEEYLKKADSVTRALLECVVEQKDEWKICKEADNMQVYWKSSPDMAKGTMHKLETILNASPKKVLVTATPTGPYRIKWDEYLDELTVEAKLNETVYLIYHGTKAMLGGLVSARDSLDVVTVDQKDDYYYVAAGTIDHPNYPPRKNSVRIQQFCSGYVIFPIEGEPDKCRFVMVMNTDLKMNSLATMVTDVVKPRLLIEKTKNLRRGLETLEINYE